MTSLSTNGNYGEKRNQSWKDWHLIISVHRGYLLDQFDTGSQVHSKVDKLPDDTLFLIFLLLEDEHVMIEELLQFLVREVDAQLLKTVELSHL